MLPVPLATTVYVDDGELIGEHKPDYRAQMRRLPVGQVAAGRFDHVAGTEFVVPAHEALERRRPARMQRKGGRAAAGRPASPPPLQISRMKIARERDQRHVDRREVVSEPTR